MVSRPALSPKSFYLIGLLIIDVVGGGWGPYIDSTLLHYFFLDAGKYDNRLLLTPLSYLYERLHINWLHTICTNSLNLRRIDVVGRHSI